MRVRDVMNINVIRVRAQTSLRRAAEVLAASNASDLAVVDETETLLGVVSEGDIMRAILPKLTEVIEAGGTLEDSYNLMEEKGHALADEPIEQVMIRQPYVLTPDDTVLKAATLMSIHNIRRLPVVEKGRLVGTLSRADVCRNILT